MEAFATFIFCFYWKNAGDNIRKKCFILKKKVFGKLKNYTERLYIQGILICQILNFKIPVFSSVAEGNDITDVSYIGIDQINQNIESKSIR